MNIHVQCLIIVSHVSPPISYLVVAQFHCARSNNILLLPSSGLWCAWRFFFLEQSPSKEFAACFSHWPYDRPSRNPWHQSNPVFRAPWFKNRNWSTSLPLFETNIYKSIKIPCFVKPTTRVTTCMLYDPTLKLYIIFQFIFQL